MCKLILRLFPVLLALQLYGQEDHTGNLVKSLLYIENEVEGFQAKLKRAEPLLEEAEKRSLPRDSVLARLLHRLAVWRYYGNNDFQSAVQLTRESIRINQDTAGTPAFTVNSYNNLGIFFSDHHFNAEALQAFDTVLVLSKQYTGYAYFGLMARLARAQVYSRLADYQQSIDEATAGIREVGTTDDWLLMKLYMERAVAAAKFNRLKDAQTDITEADALRSYVMPEDSELADFFNIRALIFEEENQTDSAGHYYEKALQSRIRSGDAASIAEEYSDVGIFYGKKLGEYGKALGYFNKALSIARVNKLDIILATIYVNQADALNRLGRYTRALEACKNGMTVLATDVSTSHSRDLIKNSRNTYLHFVLLHNEAEGRLLLSGERKDTAGLRQALETFYLADFAIDQVRRRQPAVSSKLFWSHKTRNFYRLAIEAAFLVNDTEAILYFMEKSRAVLLNDKLDELGSLAYLPQKEAAQEQLLRFTIATLEKQRSGLSPKDTAYLRLSGELAIARQQQDAFTRQLEKNFPVYFQYRYNATVPAVTDIRSRLIQPGQSFLSFFETDTLVYSLLITHESIRINRVVFPGYTDSLEVFSLLTGNRQQLNSNYERYAALAHLFYKKLIAPLQIPGGRVIVSPDRTIIPLDALTRDQEGLNYLLFDYLFSYTYSAGYLMRLQQYSSGADKGFLGLAPEYFSSESSLTTLTGSVQSLENIANRFSDTRLAKHREANRSFFLQHGGDFGLLHIYAHAQAGVEGEPRLFLSDSAIAVSELQRWQQPRVGLAFLAACETGAGQLSPGEGINSIARSFAAVGVPATIATLWTADNKVMYALSEKFYEYLGQGLTKDKALQLAKIALLKEGPAAQRLPYYWASVILSGNTDPLALKMQAPGVHRYWLQLLVLAGVVVAWTFARRRKNV